MTRLIWLSLLFPALAWCGELRGKVTDAVTGEALAQAAVEVAGRRAVTDSSGEFRFTDVQPGLYTVVVSTINYRLTRQDFEHTGDDQVFAVALQPYTLRREEKIDVTAGAFAVEASNAKALAGSELKNLASVLADDPLRAVQAMPGVTSNDDFRSQVSLRGAGYSRIGLYLDGLLLHSPFHAVQGEASSGSMTMVQGDMLESLNLYPGAIPPQFADRTGGIIETRLRDGARDRWHNAASASMSNASWVSEGPLGRDLGSWVVAARKSYLQYLIGAVAGDRDSTLAFGFTDVQGRGSINPGRRHVLMVSGFDGYSGLDRTDAIPRSGLNAIITANYHATLGSVALRSSAGNSFIVTNRVAFLRERTINRNRDDSALGYSGYGEWVGSSDASWGVRGSGLLEFGGSVRRVRDDGYANQYVFVPAVVRPLDTFRGSAVRPGAYTQFSRSWWSGRVSAAAGGRWDRHSMVDVDAFSPYASAGVQVTGSTNLRFAWGQSVQYADIRILRSLFGRPSLLPERATTVQATLEQRIDERTRLRVEVYQRNDRDLIWRPLFDARVVGNAVVAGRADAPFANSLRGYGRGVEVFLQRRTANGLTGWIAYSYGRARLRDGVLRTAFDSDTDPRHGVQSYGSWRLRATLSLSSRHVFGTGLPVPGWFTGTQTNMLLTDVRNTLRLKNYHRMDVRVNKSFGRGRVRWTLFGEVLNVWNRENVRAEEFRGFNGTTRRVNYSYGTMIPILPSAGLLVEF